MAKIPRTKHEQVREPNTDLQRRIIKAVEMLYPEYDLKDISSLHEPEDETDETIWTEIDTELRDELEEIDAHPSSVTRTVQEFMAPAGAGYNDSAEIEDIELNVPPEAQPQEYIRGLTQGIEVGFEEGIRWAEEQLDLPEGTLQNRLKKGINYPPSTVKTD